MILNIIETHTFEYLVRPSIDGTFYHTGISYCCRNCLKASVNVCHMLILYSLIVKKKKKKEQMYKITNVEGEIIQLIFGILLFKFVWEC